MNTFDICVFFKRLRIHGVALTLLQDSWQRRFSAQISDKKHKWRQVKKGIRPHLTEDNVRVMGRVVLEVLDHVLA